MSEVKWPLHDKKLTTWVPFWWPKDALANTWLPVWWPEDALDKNECWPLRSLLGFTPYYYTQTLSISPGRDLFDKGGDYTLKCDNNILQYSGVLMHKMPDTIITNNITISTTYNARNSYLIGNTTKMHFVNCHLIHVYFYVSILSDGLLILWYQLIQ